MPTAGATSPKHRVVIVDDHAMCAESLQVALGQKGYDARLVEFPDSPLSALPLVAGVRRMLPRVVLLDLDLGAFGDGLPLVGPVVRSGAEVVALTGLVDEVRWACAVEAGACTVIPKTRPLREAIDAVDLLVAGHPLMSGPERAAFLDLAARHRAGQPAMWERLHSLSLREAEVLGLLMQGHRVRQIATHGEVSVSTVRTQVKNILTKLGVSSQLAAVGMAHASGWGPPLPLPLRS